MSSSKLLRAYKLLAVDFGINPKYLTEELFEVLVNVIEYNNYDCIISPKFIKNGKTMSISCNNCIFSESKCGCLLISTGDDDKRKDNVNKIRDAFEIFLDLKDEK